MSDVIQTDEALAKQALALVKAKDLAGLAGLVLSNQTTLTAQVEEVKKDLPIVKSDLVKPHFYMVVAFAVINYLAAYYKVVIPTDVNVTVGALIGGILTSNHFKTNK